MHDSKSINLIEAIKTGEITIRKNGASRMIHQLTDDPAEGDGWRPGSPGFPGTGRD